MRNQNALAVVIVVLVLAVGFLAYQNAEQRRPPTFGESVGSAIEKAGDNIEDAADDIKDGMERR